MENPTFHASIMTRSFAQILLKFEFAICVFLEAVLFFGLFTDYSWNSLLANLFYPLVVGLLCFMVYISTLIIKPRKWLMGLCLWPGMLYGLLQLALLLLFILPPFWLADMFLIGEELDRSTVQQSISPDGSKTALVSYKPSGAYTSGLGSAEIQLIYNKFPLIKRDIYGFGKTNLSESRTDWVEWRGNSTLYVFCGHESIDISPLKYQTPFAPRLFFFTVAMLFRLLFYFVTGI